MASPVTAVGRLLKPTGSEPRIHRVIAVRLDGSVRTLINRTLPDGREMPGGTGAET